MSRKTQRTKTRDKRRAKAQEIQAAARAVMRLALAGETTEEIRRMVGPLSESPAVVKACAEMLSRRTVGV